MMKEEKYKYVPIESDKRHDRLFRHSIEHIIEKLEKARHSGLTKGLTLKKKYLDSNGKIDFNRQKNPVRHGVVHLEFNEIPDWLFGMGYAYYELNEETIKEVGYGLNDKGEYVVDGNAYDSNGYGDYVEVRIFAQHKYFIPKFKYSRSEFKAVTTAPVKYIMKDGERIYLDVLEGAFGDTVYYSNSERQYIQPFRLLWNHPNHAFYKHMTATNFNEEYISIEEAQEYRDTKVRQEEEYLNLLKRWKREIFMSILEEVNKQYGISKKKITLRQSRYTIESRYNVKIEFTPQEFVLFSGEINQLIKDIDNAVTQELSSDGKWDLSRYAESPVSRYIHSVVNGEVKLYTMDYPDLKNEDISEDTALLIIYNEEHTSGHR